MKRNLGFIIPLFLCFSLLTGFGPALHDPADPVSTTGSLYGFQDELQDDVLSDAPFELVTGKYEVSGIQRLVTDGYAAQASGKTSLTLGSSYLRSETENNAAPNTDRFEKLLISGSLSAVQGVDASQSFYINSSLIARNGAAALLDKTVQPEKGSQPLSMYLYGSEAITADGGFGANSDIFSRLYVYGSHIQAAETGILSGTISKLTIGTIKDGEDDTVLSGKLEDSEKCRWKDKGTGSVIEGGRNALVIYSENLPEYWEYEGCSEEELLKKSTYVSVKGSTLKTDDTLDKGISYGEAQDGYINHTKGSVVLIKSSNAVITFEDCELIAGKDGKGNLIQTVINNDLENMSAIPEGLNPSGLDITMKDMDVKGNILHEDYQRNLGLTLVNTKLSGAVNGYDAAHWNNAAAQEGFKDYCPDEAYGIKNIAALAVKEGSVWTATAESHLGWLYIDETSKVTGRILLDGVEQGNIQGTTYWGDVVVLPADISSAPGVHEHNWVRADGGYPPDCVNNGMVPYYCSICGEPYYDAIPALDHDWQVSYQYGPFCETEGYADYICARCGAKTEVILPPTGHTPVRDDGGYPADCENYGMKPFHCSVCGADCSEYYPPLGHDLQLIFTQPPDCESGGYDVYVCSRCGHTEFLNYKDPLGHIIAVFPSKGAETITHTYECTRCGYSYTEVHKPVGGVCTICMQSGPFG